MSFNLFDIFDVLAIEFFKHYDDYYLDITNYIENNQIKYTTIYDIYLNEVYNDSDEYIFLKFIINDFYYANIRINYYNDINVIVINNKIYEFKCNLFTIFKKY